MVDFYRDKFNRPYINWDNPKFESEVISHLDDLTGKKGKFIVNNKGNIIPVGVFPEYAKLEKQLPHMTRKQAELYKKVIDFKSSKKFKGKGKMKALMPLLLLLGIGSGSA